MKAVLVIISIVGILAVISAWYFFIKGHPLPGTNEIESMSISYYYSSSEPDSDHVDSKSFEIKDRERISAIRDMIGDLPVSRTPLLNSDEMDEEGWIINVYFKNRDFRFIPVDKNQILGIESKSSAIYEYLRQNFT